MPGRQGRITARAAIAISAIASLMLGLGASPAGADHEGTSGFTCRASFLRITLDGETVAEERVANPDEDPCMTDQAVGLGIVREGDPAGADFVAFFGFAATEAHPEGATRAEATSGGGRIVLLDGLIEVPIAMSSARVRDEGESCSLESNFVVGGAVVGGIPVTLESGGSVPLPGGGFLRHGEERFEDTDGDGESDRVIRRALRITVGQKGLGVLEIVVAESIADFQPGACAEGSDGDDEQLPRQPGFMTGGGKVAGSASHGFHLLCDEDPSDAEHELTDPSNRLQVNWKGEETTNAFHLLALTSAACTDDPDIEPRPRSSEFDTFHGEGVGRCNGEPASAEWTFTDGGEPGDADTAEIQIDGGGTCTLEVAGPLDPGGNHQAHRS